jgi:hypothetical protein
MIEPGEQQIFNKLLVDVVKKSFPSSPFVILILALQTAFRARPFCAAFSARTHKLCMSY